MGKNPSECRLPAVVFHRHIPGILNPYKSSVPFLGKKKKKNSEDPDQTPQQNAASDQGLHCLLTGISISEIE